MKFHSKWKIKSSFLIYRIQVPTLEVQHIENLSQGKCAARRCPQKPCVLVLNTSYRKESNKNEHHHPPMIIQGISWHVIRDSSLTNARSDKSYPVMETITICWDFQKLMSWANAFSFQKLPSIPTPSLQTLFTETFNSLRKQK